MTGKDQKALKIVTIAESNPIYEAVLCAFIIAVLGEDREVQDILNGIEADTIRKAFMLLAAASEEFDADERTEKAIDILREKASAWPQRNLLNSCRNASALVN